jgi:PEP-CTERM motif
LILIGIYLDGLSNDGGAPKAGGAGDGGLQKWSLIGGIWKLDYTLSAGLNLVNATTNTSGTSGLIGLTGEVIGDSVELFATSEGIADLDQTFLYGLTDSLAFLTATQAAGESFTMLEAAGPDTVIRGVAFAPVPEPASMTVLAAGLIGLRTVRRRRRVAVV